MKKILCLILLLFVLTGAKARTQASQAIPQQPTSYNENYDSRETMPAPAAPVAKPAPPAAASAPAPAYNGLPSPDVITLMQNQDFIRFMSSGTPKEIQDRISAAQALATLAPAMATQQNKDQKR